MQKLLNKTFGISKLLLFSRTAGLRFYSAPAEAFDPFQESEWKQKLILVDKNDKIIGSDTKYNCHRVKNGQIPLHRAFSVYIFNSKNELLIQQRSSSKVTFPNHVTNSCCSHQPYDIHVYRDNLQTMSIGVMHRLSFELGIPVKETLAGDLRFVTKLYYFSKGDGVWGEHEIFYLYVIRRDYTIVPNPLEISKVWWVPRSEFNDFINNCEFPLTPWFNHIKNEWLFKIWDNLEDIKSISDDKIHEFVCD